MTNSEKNKDILSSDELGKNSKKTDDYSSLLEKIRKQVDIENSSTYTRKSHDEQASFEETVVMPTVSEEVDVHAETVVLDRNEIVYAIEKEQVKEVEKSPVVLEVLGLKKRIGLKTIVEDITFDMHEGEIIGLLGPNGSGKTTIMRMMVGLTKATKGDVYCFEKPLGLGKTAMLKEVGAMIETPEFYNYMSGWSNLKQIARVCGK